METNMIDLMPEDVEFAGQLRVIMQRHKADAQFVAQLEQRLMSQPPAKPGSRNLIRLATVAAVLVIISVATLTVPPLRAIAQEIINLFTQANSDTRTDEYDAASSSPNTPFTSVESAEAAVGYDVLAPSAVPATFALTEVWADANGGYTLVYGAAGRGLMITRQPLTDRPEDDGLVGASAQVVSVQILWHGAPIEAAYVDGAWIRTNEPQQNGGTVSEDAQWLGQASMRRLRWQDGDWLYEIIAAGGSSDTADSYIDQVGMIAIAESMQ